MVGPPSTAAIGSAPAFCIAGACGRDPVFWASSHISTSVFMNKRRLPTRNDGGIGMPMHRRFLAVWSEILNILLISEIVIVSMACPKVIDLHRSGCYGIWQTESTAISGHLISCHFIWTKFQLRLKKALQKRTPSGAPWRQSRLRLVIALSHRAWPGNWRVSISDHCCQSSTKMYSLHAHV